jgi:autotransporter translocation and assembly factor TamB
MKRIVLGLLLLVLCAVVGRAWFGPSLAGWLRSRLEREITRALRVPTRIDTLTLSVSPLGVHLAGIVVGSEPAIARIDRIDVRLQLLDSVAEGRAVLTAEVNAPAFDLTHLPPSHGVPVAAGGKQTALPPLDLKKLDIQDARLRFRMGNNPATLSVAHVAGGVRTGLLRQTASAELEVAGVTLQRNSYQVKVDEIRATGGRDAGGLFLGAATVRGDGVIVSVNATSNPHRPRISATFEPRLLGVVVDELAAIGGEAHLEGSLVGDLAAPVLDARLVVEHAAIAQHQLGKLDTHATLAGASLKFDDVHLVSTAGDVTGAVDLVMSNEVPLNGELNWSAVDLESLLAVIGVAVPFNARLGASTAVHGSLDPLDLGITGSGTLQGAGAAAAETAAQFEIGGRVRAHAVETQIELKQRGGNHLGVQFALSGAQLGGTVKLTAADLGTLTQILPRPVHVLALTGQAEVTAAFGGTTERPSVEGTVAMRGLTVMGAPVPRLSGDFAVAAGTLTTKRMRMEAAAGNAELSGALALAATAQNSWQLSLQDLSTDVILGAAQGFGRAQNLLNGGTVDGTLHCRGEWRRANIEADLTAKSLRIGREPLEHVDVNVTTTLPRWTLRMEAVHTGNERLTVEGTGEGMDRLSLSIDTTPVDLAKWRIAGRRHVVGTLDLHGRISGDPLRPDGWIQLSGTGLGAAGHQLGDVSLRADGQRGNWVAKGETFGGAITVDASLQTVGALPYTFAVRWRDADLARLVSGDSSLHVTSSGEIALHGALREVTSPTGAVVVSQFEARRDEYLLRAAEPIRIEANRGRFQIQSFVLEGQGSRLTVGGEWTTSGQVALDVQGDADLVLLELIGPPFQSSQGHVSVMARLRRNTETGWDLQGQAAIRNAAVDAGLPVVFTDTNGDVTFAGSHIRIEQLGGKAGGGGFTVGGAIDVNRGPELSWRIEGVSLSVPAWLEERVSGSGRVDGTWRALTVSGDIEVLNALYDRRIELTDFLPWFKAQVAPVPRTEAAATEVRLELRIHASGGLFIDNNFAKAELRADLRVGGTTEKPVLTGTLDIISGEVTFRNRTFVVTGGSIDFQDRLQINPVLNISAESRISTSEADYTVFVLVSGTADAPRVQFSADDPSLSQNDILSLVATGKTMAQAQREGGAVSVLNLMPTGTVEQEFRSLLGVDRFEIEPVYSHDTGTFEPRVTIGKDITDRLRVQAASGMGVDVHRSMQVEYRLTYRISLLGTWEGQTQQQAGAYGGDIKFRYEFRRLPFSLLGRDVVCTPQSDVR